MPTTDSLAKMKQMILWFVFVAIFSGCATIPAPEMAVGVRFDDDPVNWSAQNFEANSNGFILEFVPEGDQLSDWREMVAQQILFTTQSLSEHIGAWRSLMMSADPAMEINKIAEASFSSTWIYRSDLHNEIAVRRFWQGPDGIYALAYHARPKENDEDRLTLWTNIVENATLGRTPAKR